MTTRIAISFTASTTLRLRVRVHPNAAHARVLAVRPERLDIAVTHGARDGAANRGLGVFVSKVLGVPRSAVVMLTGAKARDKVLLVDVNEGEGGEGDVDRVLRLFQGAGMGVDGTGAGVGMGMGMGMGSRVRGDGGE